MPSSTSREEILGEGEMGMKKVITICPTVEELRLTSGAASSGSHLVCPVPGCRSFTFKNQRGLVQHTNALHPQLSQHKSSSAKEKSEDYHFHCPQADCVYNSHLKQRWFSSLDHLRYHYINTHEEKRFACTKCGKRFGWKRDQEYHERECGQTFNCGTCPAQYPSRRSLLTHCLRKQHPVPPQFEKPAQKAKDSSKVSPSTARKPGLPQQSVTSSTTSSSSGVSSSRASPVPSEVSPSVISSALPVVTAGSSAQSGSTGNPAILLSSCSDIPDGVSIAIMPPAIVSVPELPRAVTARSNASVTTTDAVSAGPSSHSPAGILKPVCDSSDTTICAPAVSLGSLEVTPPSADGADMSVPSSSASTESLKALHASQPSPRNLDMLAVSLSNSFSLPQPGVCHGATGSATVSQQVLPQAASTGLLLPEDSSSSYPSTTTPQGEAGESISKLCITQKHSAQTCSNVNMISAPQTHTLGVVSHVTPVKTTPAKTKPAKTKPAKTTATNTGQRKKLRPILPKSREVVVVGGANAPTLYTNPDSGQGMGCVLHSSVLPWIGGTSLDAATAVENPEGKGVSAACQTSVDCGSEGEKDRVQVPVVHMATQVSGGALHPISICHTGTQVYTPALLRGDSIHTAVQTCVQTTHSGTQLAAPLPGHEGAFEDRRMMESASRQPEEERRQVCAVAIQTGGHVDMVNMAIQATAQQHPALDPLSAQSAGLVLDMIQLCDSQPEHEGHMGMMVPRVNSSLAGTHTASQTSFPYIMLNKANRTNSTGTQVATGFPAEELDVASKGMQTSVTLIHRPKLGKMAAQTQTCSVAGAGGRSPRSQSRASGGRMRKRSTKCSEVQTQPCSPRAKKGRRKGADTTTGLSTIDVQEISIATQTLTEETVYQAHATSSTLSMPHAAVWASRNDKPHTSHRSGRIKNSKSSKGKEVQSRSTAKSPQYQQNPPLSVAATQEDPSGVWDPFFSSPVTAPPSSPPPQNLSPHLEDLLSEYRVELGVQTPQDFLSEFTADFGMQTMGGMLSSTSDLAVQTLAVDQQPCTAELGVQTVTSALGYLLDNLDADFPCSSLEEDILCPTPSSLSSFPSSSDSDAATQALTLQNIKTSSSAPQVHSMGSQSEMFDLNLDGSIPSPHIGAAPKLFDSFDSDLSFSDCGTGTEDFFASTHTQTSGVEVMMEEDCLSPPLSSLYGQSGLEASLSLNPLPPIGDKGSSAHGSSQLDVFATSSDNSLNEVSGLTGEPVVTMDFCPSPGGSQPSRPTSCSTTDTDLLSGVPATDMHTQTADDLLTFLMNNMETQTTEDLSCDQIAVADTHTQTSTSVLLTPPHPLSSLDSSSSWLGEDEGVVSAETQTSAQLMWDLQQDQEELFDLTDMETQTMLW